MICIPGVENDYLCLLPLTFEQGECTVLQLHDDTPQAIHHDRDVEQRHHQWLCCVVLVVCEIVSKGGRQLKLIAVFRIATSTAQQGIGSHSIFSLWQLEGISSPCCMLTASHNL